MDKETINQLKNSLDTEIQQERFELLAIAGNNFLPEELLYLAKLEDVNNLEKTYLTARAALNREEINHKKYAEYSTLLHAIQKDLESANPSEQVFLKSLGELKQSGLLDQYIDLAAKGGQELDKSFQEKNLKDKNIRKRNKLDIPKIMDRREELASYLAKAPHFNALEDLEQRVYVDELLKDVEQLPKVLANAVIEQKLAAQGYSAVRRNTEFMFDRLLNSKRREVTTRMFKNSDEFYDVEIKHGASTRMIVYTPGKEIEYWEKLLIGVTNVRWSDGKWKDGLVFTADYAEKTHKNSREKLIQFYEGQEPEQIKKALLIWTTMFSFYDKKENETAIPSTKEERSYMLSHLVNPNGDINAAFEEFKALFKLRPEIFPRRASRILNEKVNILVNELDLDDIEEEDASVSEEEDLLDDELKEESLINKMFIRRKVSKLIPKPKKSTFRAGRDQKAINEEKRLEVEESKPQIEVTKDKVPPFGDWREVADLLIPKQVPNGGFFLLQDNVIWERDARTSLDVFYHPTDIQRMNRKSNLYVFQLGVTSNKKFEELSDNLFSLREAGEYDQSFDVIYNYIADYYENHKEEATEEEHYSLAQALISQYLSSSFVLNPSGETFARVFNLCNLIHSDKVKTPFLSENLNYSLRTMHSLWRFASVKHADKERGFQLPNIYGEGWNEDLEKYQFDNENILNIQNAIHKLRVIQFNREASNGSKDPRVSVENVNRAVLGYADYIFSTPSEDQRQKKENTSFGRYKTIDAEVLSDFENSSKYLHQGNRNYAHYFDEELPKRTEEIQKGLNSQEYSVEDLVTNKFHVLQSKIYKLDYYTNLIAEGEELNIELGDLMDEIVELQDFVENGAVILHNENFERLAVRSRLITSLKLVNNSTEGNPDDSIRWDKIKAKTADALVIMSRKLDRENKDNDKLDQYVYDLYTMLNQAGYEPVKEVYELRRQNKDEDIQLGRVSRPRNVSKQEKESKSLEVFTPRTAPNGGWLVVKENKIWEDNPLNSAIINYHPIDLQKNYREDNASVDKLRTASGGKFANLAVELASLRDEGEHDRALNVIYSYFNQYQADPENDKNAEDYYRLADTLINQYLSSRFIVDRSGDSYSQMYNFCAKAGDILSRGKAGDLIARGAWRGNLVRSMSTLQHLWKLDNARSIDVERGFQLPNIYTKDWSEDVDQINMDEASFQNIKDAVGALKIVQYNRNTVNLIESNSSHGAIQRSVEGYADRIFSITSYEQLEKDYWFAKEKLRIAKDLTEKNKGELGRIKSAEPAILTRQGFIKESLEKKDGRFTLEDKVINDVSNLQTQLYKLEYCTNLVANGEELEFSLHDLKDYIVRIQSKIEQDVNQLDNEDLKQLALRGRLVSTLKLLHYSTDGSPEDSMLWGEIRDQTVEALELMSKKLNRRKLDNDKLDQYIFDIYTMLGQGGQKYIKEVIDRRGLRYPKQNL